jgi:hypothetical protein
LLGRFFRRFRGVVTHEQNVFILEHYFASKSFLLLLKHLVKNALTRKYRTRQQITDWQQHFGTEEVFVCDQCLLSDKRAYITAAPIWSNKPAATMAKLCRRQRGGI